MKSVQNLMLGHFGGLSTEFLQTLYDCNISQVLQVHITFSELDIYSRSQGQCKVLIGCFSISRITNLVKIKCAMHETYTKITSCISVLFIDFAFIGR